jgi:uncharacterized protein YegP (UPF0339 family)
MEARVGGIDHRQIRNAKDPGQAIYLCSENPGGSVLLTSEPHCCRAGALAGIDAVRQSAARCEWFERRKAAADQSYFVLTTAKGRVLGCGPIHTTRRTMEKGIHAVMDHDPAAETVDASGT